MCVCLLSHFSCVQLFVTLWTVARQTPLSMEFSRQEYWSGLPSFPPGDLPDPGIEPVSPTSPALQADPVPLGHRRSPCFPVLRHGAARLKLTQHCKSTAVRSFLKSVSFRQVKSKQFTPNRLPGKACPRFTRLGRSCLEIMKITQGHRTLMPDTSHFVSFTGRGFFTTSAAGKPKWSYVDMIINTSGLFIGNFEFFSLLFF